MKKHLIIIVLLELIFNLDAAVLPSKGKERIMQDGPKVAIRSTALNIISRQKNSDLHEIYLTPYRYVSTSDLLAQSPVIENAIDTICIIHSSTSQPLKVIDGFLPTEKWPVFVYVFRNNHTIAREKAKRK